MATGRTLGDLRGAIEDINRKVMEERGNGEAPNAVVLARLKEERARLVEHFAPQLKEMALTKLLNDVCRKNAARSGLSQQRELFEGYRNIPNTVTISRGYKKATAKLKLSEAEGWLQSHSKPVPSKNHEDFHRLIEKCQAHATSADETIEQVLVRIRQPAESTRTLDLTLA